MAEQDLFDLRADTVRCPHAVFTELQGEPIHRVEAIDAWVVTRYEDIAWVNRHPDLFSNRLATGPVLARQLAATVADLAETDEDVRRTLQERAGRGTTKVLLNADPPLHSRQRALVNRAFTPMRVRTREPLIRSVAEDLVAAFADRGEVELVTAFAVPLPLTLIAVLLGVPVEDMAAFKRWSDDFVVAIGNHHLTAEQSRRMILSQAEFFGYFAERIAERRVAPTDDLLSELVTARLDGEELTEQEMLSMCNQFLVAGNETTTKLIASAMLWLTRRPELADSLRGDPDAIRLFVEEVLRLEAPVQGLFRVANQATTVGGVDIPEGAALWLVYGAGNRDASVYAEPGECRPERTLRDPHLAFGLGEHFCLGAALARAEARIGLEVLLDAMDGVRLAVPEEELDYEPSYALRGLHRLPLVFTPRRSPVGAPA